MKYLTFALGWLFVSAVHGQEYKELCSGAQKTGVVENPGGAKFQYTCDKSPPSDASLNESNMAYTADECANLCKDHAQCTVSTWFHNICDLYNYEGNNNVDRPGYLLIRPVDQDQLLQQCQADLKRFGPVEPICPGNSGKMALVKNQKFGLACNTQTSTRIKVGNRDSLEKCMESCVERNSCRYATWSDNNKGCWLGNDTLWWGTNSQSDHLHSAFKMSEN